MEIQWSNDGLTDSADDLIVSWSNRNAEQFTATLATTVCSNADSVIPNADAASEYNYTDVYALTNAQMGEVVMWLVECGCTILEHPDKQAIAWNWGE